MIRVNFVVEGQTEETFVERVLGPYLAEFGVYCFPRCVETSRQGQRIFRGGLVRYEKARQDVLQWLKQDRTAWCTTFFDLFRLPNSFPGYAKHAALGGSSLAKALESEFAADVGHEHFVPHIQPYEFEGLLFASTGELASVAGNLGLANELQKIRAAFPTPEDINGGAATAPSKRLLNLWPGYDKVAFGPRVAERIGMPTLLQECPHFRTWVESLKRLATEPA